ncbi:glucose PTS transporter subunit IIA [Erysipelotrichaceae bacterium 51-3]
MIGSAAGGLYAGLTHTHRFATGSSGLPAVVMYIGDGSMQYFYNIIIALAIDIVVTAIAVVILQKVWAHQNKKVATPSAASQTPAPVKDPTRSTSRPGEFVNVCTGKRIDKSEIPDPTFSTGLMGETCGIIPETGLITAPFKGQVMMIAPTRHAIGLVSDDGREVLIHVGIDTVYMEGKGFEVLVESNQTFQTGQPLLRFDIEEIEKAGYSPIVNVILTNTAAYSEVTLDLDNPEQLILV